MIVKVAQLNFGLSTKTDSDSVDSDRSFSTLSDPEASSAFESSRPDTSQTPEFRVDSDSSLSQVD